MGRCLFFLFVIVTFHPAAGQNRLLFRNYSVDHGLSSGTVRCITQDNKGYMWFGTKRGLNRFDGTRVKIYQHDKEIAGSIGSDFIRALITASDSTLWIGTDKGAFVFNTYTEKFVPFVPLQGRLVYDLLKDRTGKIWIAYGGGVQCFDPEKKTSRQFATVINNQFRADPATSLEEDSDGNIWVGTESKGIIVLNAKNGRRTTYNTENSKLPDNDILSLYKDISGNIWIGTMNAGLARFDRMQMQFTVYKKGGAEGLSNNIIRSVFQLSPGQLLVGTENGLNILDTVTNRFTVYRHEYNNQTSISDNAVYAVYGDKQGGIWIGTYFGGVNYLHKTVPGIDRFLPTGNPGDLSGRAVSCFLEDNTGNMWIGTEDAGLNYLNVQTKEFQLFPFFDKHQQLPYHNLHVLKRDSKGFVWIGMFSGGLSVYNPVTRKIKSYKNLPGDPSSISSNAIYSIYEDRDQRMWVGTLKGLNIYDPASDSFMRVPDTERYSVYAIYETMDGTIWIATNNTGLLARNKQSGEWLHFTADGKKGALSSPKLLSMVDDGRGNLWVGTEGGGLNRFSFKTRTSAIIGDKKGLPAKVIYSLVIDKKGYLWITTELGLYSLHTESEQIRYYSLWGGIKSLNFNYQAGYIGTDGKIYVGGTNGFAAFYPDSLRKFNIIPGIALSNFQVFNRDVVSYGKNSPLQSAITYADKIVLKHNQAVINIEYAGLSYIDPEKINYSYKLEGLEKEWNKVGNLTRAGYTNLSPGRYIFRVKADVGFDTEDVPEASIQVIVLPPFYKTTWAYIVYILALAGTLLLLRRYYQRKQQRENEIRLERLRIKNEKEFYNQKIDFFTMMAHEVRTPLSLIAGPVEQLLDSNQQWPEAGRQQLETINKNTDRLCNLVNQLLDFRRIESDFYELHPQEIEVVAHIKSIYNSFAAALQNKALQFTWHASVDRLMLKADPEALTKIVSNLITNALKFARTRVAVQLAVKEQLPSGTSLSVSVEDDGIGIPAGQLDNIFKKFFKISSGEHEYNNLGGTGIGLALAKSLTEKSGGGLDVFSRQGEYTVFTVLLPCTPNAGSLPTETEPVVNISKGPQILVVEDDAELRHFIEGSLKAGGYSTLAATNGREALDIVDAHDIALIISDVMMPEIDGVLLCKMVKEDISRCHIPVILLTAKTDSKTELSGIESGADIYITKPFKVKHLVARVKNLLETRKKLMQKYGSYPLSANSPSAGKSKDQQFIEQVIKFIEAYIANPDLSVESLSTEMAMSKSAFQRKMKALTDQTPNEFIRLIRLKYAAGLLLSNEHRISEIGYMSGFSSHSYFSRCFYEHFKLTPSEYIEKYDREKS